MTAVDLLFHVIPYLVCLHHHLKCEKNVHDKEGSVAYLGMDSELYMGRIEYVLTRTTTSDGSMAI